MASATKYGVELLIASRRQPEGSFVETARDFPHYLLRCNVFSLSWAIPVGAGLHEGCFTGGQGLETLVVASFLYKSAL